MGWYIYNSQGIGAYTSQKTRFTRLHSLFIQDRNVILCQDIQIREVI